MNAGPWIRILLVLVLCAPTALAQDRGISISRQPLPITDPWGEYHALILGINNYTEWSPLRTPVKDAVALRNVLIQNYGFKPENVVLRTDATATRLQIIRDLRYFAGGLNETDNLLIYYAGHGQLDDLTGEGYWIPVEGKLKDTGTWVPHVVLKSILSSDKVRLKNVVVIADSCYSGTLLRGGPSLLSLSERNYTERLRQVASYRSRQVITSGGLEPVVDGGRDGHSLFAYYFLNALKSNDRAYIDLENLFHSRVWKPVMEIGNQRPSVGRLKTPMDEDGQFVLTKREPSEKWPAVSEPLKDRPTQPPTGSAGSDTGRTMAAVPPAVVSSVPPRPAREPLTFAVVPFKIFGQVGYELANISTQSTYRIIAEILRDDPRVALRYTFYEYAVPEEASPPLMIPTPREELEKAVWKQKGLLTRYEINHEALSEYGSSLGTDLVLTVKAVSSDWTRLEIYLYDVDRNELITEKVPQQVQYQVYQATLRKALEKSIEKLMAAREQ